jgi:hypothetical protein
MVRTRLLFHLEQRNPKNLEYQYKDMFELSAGLLILKALNPIARTITMAGIMNFFIV